MALEARALLVPFLLTGLVTAFRVQRTEGGLAAATPFEDASASLTSSQAQIEAARNDGMLMDRWREISSALQHSASAAASASRAVAAGEETWNGLARSIAQGDMTVVLDGDASYNEVRDLPSGSLALSLCSDLRSLAQELSQFASLEKDIVDAILSSTSITRGIDELRDAWRTVDLSLIRGLESDADAIQSQVDHLHRRLIAADTMLTPLLQDWDQIGRWTKARRTYTNQRVMILGLNDIGEANHAIGELLQDAARMLARNVQQSADSLVVETSRIAIVTNHGLGATESIERYKCEPPGTRTFAIGRLVDETTMSCIEYPLIGYKRCSCTRAEDCYVTSELRETRPELKRCFRPV